MILSFLYSFLPSSWCAVGSDRPQSRQWLIERPYSDGLLRHPGVFLTGKVNARRSVQIPRFHLIITLIISDLYDWRDTRGKWSLARNSDRSWWHLQTNLKRFLLLLLFFLFFCRSLWLHEHQVFLYPVLSFFPSFFLPDVRWSVHSPRYYLIVTLIISRQTWMTRHSWQVAFG